MVRLPRKTEDHDFCPRGMGEGGAHTEPAAEGAQELPALRMQVVGPWGDPRGTGGGGSIRDGGLCGSAVGSHPARNDLILKRSPAWCVDSGQEQGNGPVLKIMPARAAIWKEEKKRANA